MFFNSPNLTVIYLQVLKTTTALALPPFADNKGAVAMAKKKGSEGPLAGTIKSAKIMLDLARVR